MANISAMQSAVAQSMNNMSQTLLQNKKAIDIISNNIANMNTEGFSRVSVSFTSLPTGGVVLSGAKRIFDKMLYLRILDSNQKTNYYQSLDTTLYQIESIFSDSINGGFSKKLDDFYLSLNEVISNPENMASRDSFLQNSKMIANSLQNSDDALHLMSETNKKYVYETIQDINRLTSQLAEINKNIKYFSNDDMKLNAYLDNRDMVLKELSSLIDIDVKINRDKSVDVATAKGLSLVTDDRSQKLFLKSKNLVMTNSYLLKTASTITKPNDLISDSGTLTINYKLDGEDKSLDVDYTNRSLLDIAKYINENDKNLNAKVINVGSQTAPDYRLEVSTTFKNRENYIFSIDDSDANDSSGFDVSNSNEIYQKKYSKMKITYSATDISGLLKSSKLAALIKGEEFINETSYKINRFARDFSFEVNSIHRLGYNLYNETGEDLFVKSGSSSALEIDASNIDINFEDPRKLAVGLKNGVLGDNQIAKAMLNTKNGELSYYDDSDGTLKNYNDSGFFDNYTPNDFYINNIENYIASKKRSTKNSLDDHQLLLTTLEKKKEDMSGVNLDEELVRLMQLQRSYQANAKIITVADELFKTLIEMAQ